MRLGRPQQVEHEAFLTLSARQAGVLTDTVVTGGPTFGLVQAGMPESVALAAVLMYRLATFYLPPTLGYFALRWLEHNEHL